MHFLYQKKRTIVVVFCYNVEKHIYILLNKIKKKEFSQFNFLFIEDNSKDRTKNILTIYKNVRNFEIKFNKKNYGFGLNYKYAIQYAIKNKYEKLIFLHGDNQYPASKVININNDLDYADLCYGSRKLLFNSMKKNMPIFRFIFNILLTKFINIFLRNNASEYFSGLRGIRVEKLKKINLKKLANNWIIEQEIHFIFIKNKYKFRETAITTTYDKNHKSLIPPIKYVSLVILFTLYYSFLKN
jgi:glycosyltransferase involved in cell wall biosynthesis